MVLRPKAPERDCLPASDESVFAVGSELLIDDEMSNP